MRLWKPDPDSKGLFDSVALCGHHNLCLNESSGRVSFSTLDFRMDKSEVTQQPHADSNEHLPGGFFFREDPLVPSSSAEISLWWIRSKQRFQCCITPTAECTKRKPEKRRTWINWSMRWTTGEWLLEGTETVDGMGGGMEDLISQAFYVCA